MNHGSTRPSRLPFVLAGIAACAILAWVVHRARRSEVVPPQEQAEEVQPAPSAPPPAPIAAPRLPAPPAPAPPREEIITSDGLPIMPVHGSPDGPAHPHPITPQHLRIFAENRLVGAITGAIDVGDAGGVRRLLEQYRREYPEDNFDLQGGYALIADCLEHRTDETRAAAERWLDSHNGSGAKRFLVRTCIDPPLQ